MKILITGVCGFVGASIARGLLERDSTHQVFGLDKFSRPGSWLNSTPLQTLGAKIRHGALRTASDLEWIPAVDWVIDAAANPSVLAGVDGTTTSRKDRSGVILLQRTIAILRESRRRFPIHTARSWPKSSMIRQSRRSYLRRPGYQCTWRKVPRPGTPLPSPVIHQLTPLCWKEAGARIPLEAR